MKNKILNIISVGRKPQDELIKSVDILNRFQTEFNFNLVRNSKVECLDLNEIYDLSWNQNGLKDRQFNHSTYYPKKSIYSLSFYFYINARKSELNIDDDSKYVFILDDYLYSQELNNLFINNELIDGYIGQFSILTCYSVDYILGDIPIQLYIMYWFLRIMMKNYVQSNFYHYESKNCFFDGFIDKREIVQILKTGNICFECQLELDSYIDFNQVIAINTILRIIGRVSRSKNPVRNFDDFLAITKFIKKQTKSIEVLPIEIIEEIISKVIRSTSNSENEKLNKLKLKTQLGKGNIKEVFDFLLQNTSLNEELQVYNELILLLSSFTRISSWNRKGKMSYENYSRELIRITDSLILIIDDL